jgi:SpoVK/Ycf46/Vps4 family AAA+-type ATPase
VIIENLDVVGTKVSRSESNSSFIAQLRSQIERINAMRVQVVVLATCTELEAVDIALRAPHIFGKEIEIPVPALKQREDILHKLLRSFDHRLGNDEIKKIASITHGFVGADLKSLLAQSYLHAQRRRLSNNATTINIQDIDDCIKIVHPSAMKSILIDVPNVSF